MANLPLLTFTQAWCVLCLAILAEVAGTTSMRLSDGFSRLGPSLLIFVCYAVSFSLNTLIVRTLGLSVVYAVWSAVGTVLTAAIGCLYFKEPFSLTKALSMACIVLGVAGLHWSSRSSA